jgi:sugar O-acyltransferase (sialic acid O-acetyltransferase NeuD family)
MKKVIIFGTGAQAKYAINTLSLQDKHQIEGLIKVIPDQRKEKLTSLLGKPVLGGLKAIERYSTNEVSMVVAVSNNKLKEELARTLLEKGFSFLNCIHPSAVIAPSAKLGTGVIVNASAIIQPLAKIGNFVMIHAGVIVEHDNIIEDYVNLAPGVKLAGWVHIKKGATIHTGASVIPCKEIGENSVVGAGSVVINDIDANQVVCGVPARKVK